MALASYKRRRNKKPTNINQSSGFAKRLACTHLISARKGDSVHDAISRETHILDGAATWQATPYGMGIDIAADNDAITFENTIPINQSNGAWFSVFMHYDIDSWEGANSGILRTATNGIDFFIRDNTQNRLWIRWGGTNVLRPSSGQTLDTGEHTLTISMRNNSGGSPLGEYKVYIDGILEYSGTHSLNAGSDEFIRYGWQSTVSERMDGRTFTLAFFDEEISNGEAKLLHRTKGGVLFEPKTQYISLEEGVPPSGAVMNQLQGSNVGADLFNGTIQ